MVLKNIFGDEWIPANEFISFQLKFMELKIYHEIAKLYLWWLIIQNVNLLQLSSKTSQMCFNSHAIQSSAFKTWAIAIFQINKRLSFRDYSSSTKQLSVIIIIEFSYWKFTSFFPHHFVESFYVAHKKFISCKLWNVIAEIPCSPTKCVGLFQGSCQLTAFDPFSYSQNSLCLNYRNWINQCSSSLKMQKIMKQETQHEKKPKQPNNCSGFFLKWAERFNKIQYKSVQKRWINMFEHLNPADVAFQNICTIFCCIYFPVIYSYNLIQSSQAWAFTS